MQPMDSEHSFSVYSQLGSATRRRPGGRRAVAWRWGRVPQGEGNSGGTGEARELRGRSEPVKFIVLMPLVVVFVGTVLA
jgi:hypothetical protein